MADQYSPKQFFRNVSNDYLIKYFSVKGIDFPLDLKGVSEHSVDIMFDSFLKLEDKVQLQVEYDFQCVHALSSDGGILALTDEAKEHSDYDFVDCIGDIEGHHNRAMWAFINRPEYWNVASIYLQADKVSASSWRRLINLPKAKSRFTKSDIELFSGAIRDYYHNTQGRGRNCKVELYKRGNRYYFYAFPEDFAKRNSEWINNLLKDQSHFLAFEIVFVYCPEQNSLDVYAKNNTKSIKKLQNLFAENILKRKISLNEHKHRLEYDLNIILDPGFKFIYSPESKILSVDILEATIADRNKLGSKIKIIETNKDNKHAVRDQIEKLNLTEGLITEVVFKVYFYPTNSKKTKPRRFKLSKPDKCNLGCIGNDLIIKQMLSDSGVEPQNKQLFFKWF